ncbi:COBRA-like protein 7 [Castanea sativa]|uniref:COBRA-like protein 7 n=1 Tax=Castanea sativa TaxID=21020 RepID=UPI003F64ACAC
MASQLRRHFYVAVLLLLTILPSTLSQQATGPNSCNGIYVSYAYVTGSQLPPNLTGSDPTHQPYRFESVLTVQNNDRVELQSWKVFVGFQHGELLVSATNAVIGNGGTGSPASVGNGTVLVGYPMTDLKTATETAGDLTQMRVQVSMVGTQFGVAPPGIPMPSNISLVNDGWSCPKSSTGKSNVTEICCVQDPNAKTNITASDGFLARGSGDLTIMYDVTQTYESNYWAQVTISNHNPLGRLDYWKLSWEWMNDEFIFAMKGAYPSVVDSSECIFGPQGIYYQSLDFSTVLNCQRRPTIIDLPATMYNDTILGFKPYCCRNGTILPTEMDPSKSISSFQMQVFKMPPDLNRSQLSPPMNWAINGTLNPNYQCSQPVQVSPSEFPASSGVPVNSTAVASWQVVCNITIPKSESPKCCVSFSAYYNDSVIPCKTCACGCPSNTARTCSATAPAMLLPSNALLVPFDNRTALSTAWARLQHEPVPNPLPCGDNCGVSINWHLYTDYTNGWSARITLFNWGDTSFADWFAAVELDKASAGFQQMYSFNGSTLSLNGVNDTIFMQGNPGLNYLVAEDQQQNPWVPGKQQSVISFTKKLTPGINVAKGDGFPTKVYFNGEECSLPSTIPSSGSRKVPAAIFSVLSVVVFMLMWQ